VMRLGSRVAYGFHLQTAEKKLKKGGAELSLLYLVCNSAELFIKFQNLH
jgi:hypothetical protein